MTVTNLTIDGSPGYYVYGDVAGADAHFNGQNQSRVKNWLALADADAKGRQLFEASEMLDRQLWAGAVTDPDTPQPRQHPRTGLTDRWGNAIDEDTVAPDIVTATYELALALLDRPSIQTAVGGAAGKTVTAARAGAVGLTFSSSASKRSSRLPFPKIVNDLVYRYLRKAQSSLIQPAIGPIDLETSFPDDNYGVSEGLP